MFVAETCIVSKTRENIMGLDNTQQFYLDHADWIMPTVLFGTVTNEACYIDRGPKGNIYRVHETPQTLEYMKWLNYPWHI